MRCADARRLLLSGVVPGASGSRNPYLGFHLASCPDCRAYRAYADRLIVAARLEPRFKLQGSRFKVSDHAHDFEARPDKHAPTQGEFRVPRFEFRVPRFEFRALRPQASRSPASPASPRRFLPAAAILSALALAPLLLLGWWFALPLLRAVRNIEAMYSPSVPVRPAARPVPRLVAATVTPVSPSLAMAPAPTIRARLLAVPPTATVAPTATATAEPTPAPTATPELPPVTARTILLLGIDARPGEGFIGRSDALMLARVDPERPDVALLSLPRDLWAAIPGYGENKINAAFAWGELDLARQAVSNALGIPIDNVVAIDFAGFRSLVDAVGGVTIDVPVELYDSAFPTDDYGYMVAHFLPGPQQMDGATALVYARTRHPDSDFERMKRQQQVLIDILERIRERGALQNLHEADMLTAALLPFVRTDIPPAEALALLWRLRDFDAAKVRRYTVDDSMLYATTINGSFALVAPEGVLPEMGRRLLDGGGRSAEGGGS